MIPINRAKSYIERLRSFRSCLISLGVRKAWRASRAYSAFHGCNRIATVAKPAADILGSERGQDVRAPAGRKAVFSLAQQGSIGDKSGE